jgi:pyridoxine 5'-phosphate synthase PdxJ
VVGGSKEGLNQWKDARDTYSRLSKSEVFTDMLENAQLDKSKFSMSGIENSLAQQLRQLAKNDKKMRLFTEAEQDAIKSAAKGGTGQNILRFIGKFAPTSSVGSIAPILATAANAPLGLAMTAGGIGARAAATQMRKSDVNKLAALMRAGAKGKENE